MLGYVLSIKSRILKITIIIHHSTLKGVIMATVKSAKRAGNNSVSTKSSRQKFSPEQRNQMIAEAAYFYAEKRGFFGGDPMDDWLTAEAEIDSIFEIPMHH